ncbi:MAG TPA: alcohol dehydrogenase catalytic domain-containing protein [Verrucomicrobiae bacterium]|nr:alcohol dehydrogenase catalytic domain-containing protein [Verrucomicrobiae bacterium]
MQAALYCGKEDIRVQSIPEPEVGPADVLVRVVSTGICGTDMQIYGGRHPRARAPLVPGHEIFGRIADAGNAAGAKWRTGMRVAAYPLLYCRCCRPCREGNTHVCEKLGLTGIDCDGGFAEYVKVAPHQLIPVPDEVSDLQAAVIEPLAVAVHAVNESNFQVGQTALVTGGGPIGNLLAQTLRAAGARQVVVSECKPFRREIAGSLGFAAFDPSAETAPEALERLTGERCADIVFEATGHAAAYHDAVACCSVRGQISFVGIPKTPPALDILKIVYKEIQTTSARVYRFRDYLGAIALLSRGVVDVAPLVTDRIALAEAPLAYRKMRDADSSAKILVVPE